MKFFIVGKHASGKHQVLNTLEDEYGVRVGREFCNIPHPAPPQLYIDPKYIRYSFDDISKIFENRGYVCISGIRESGILDGNAYYRGISFYTIDNSDVIVISPEQMLGLNWSALRDDTCFVWMDNTRDNRIHRYSAEKRTYSFMEVEKIESEYDADFVKAIYNFQSSGVLYFNNEEPERVACIVAACIKHPDLLSDFTKNFN